MKKELNNTFSIITPSFNQGQFIEETIKSVLSQEGSFYIDYIIADGGSRDKSIEIIKKYDKDLKNNTYPIRCKGISFRWWSKPDKGQSYAINQGFKIARGSILAWINSDDYYELGAFKFIFNKFNENPKVDLIYGDCYEINKNSKELRTFKQINFKEMAREGCLIFQPSTYFTKRILKRVGT